MKHTTLLTLALIMLLIICSCSEDGGSKSSASAKNTVTSADDTQTETADITDGLGDFNFGGATFTIVYSAEQLGSGWPYCAEEITGELFNDTVYERDAAVQERFNVNIDYVNAPFINGGTGNEVPDVIMKSVMAGDGQYQLGISHTYGSIPSLISGGYLYNFNKLPGVDVSKPWWNQSMRTNLEIEGVLPIAVSDLVYSYADVIYFNKDLVDKYNLNNPYNAVNDGTWTWTMLAENAVVASSDIDGDGKQTAADQYGYATPGETPSLMTRIIHSNGMTMASIGSDGRPTVLGLMCDRLQTACERYYDLLYNNGLTYIGTKTNKAVDVFSVGNILYMHQTTLQLPAMRNIEFDFGILPLPKYDEAQDNYASLLSSQLLVVPSDVAGGSEFVGTVIEALSYESYKRLVPVVYETVVANKYMRDETSYKIYLTIRNSLVCDFNWNYGNGNAITSMIVQVLFNQKSTDLASYYAANADKVQSQLDKIYESIQDVYLGK